MYRALVTLALVLLSFNCFAATPTPVTYHAVIPGTDYAYDYQLWMGKTKWYTGVTEITPTPTPVPKISPTVTKTITKTITATVTRTVTPTVTPTLVR